MDVRIQQPFKPFPVPVLDRGQDISHCWNLLGHNNLSARSVSVDEQDWTVEAIFFAQRQ